MNVVALGHGKIDLFRVMCLSNPRHTFGRHVLYVPHTVISQYIIHNARHKSQKSRNVLCNYYPTRTSRVIVFQPRYCLTLSVTDVDTLI